MKIRKIILILSVFMLFSPPVCANRVYDAQWCRENGGIIEFDTNRNINFNCIAYDINSDTYIEKLYNIVCIPCYSSILKNKEPLFLKIIGSNESGISTMFDVYNYKMTENELIRYI